MDILIDGRKETLGKEITIVDKSLTGDSIKVVLADYYANTNSILLVNDDEVEEIVSLKNIKYCQYCDAYHINDFEANFWLFGYEEFKYKEGYIDALSDFFNYLKGEDTDFIDCLEKIESKDGKFDIDLDAFYELYVNGDESVIPVPKYTHEQLVELIGHEFKEA